MASRYYVGGNNSNWDDTTSWAATSGGAPGASVPTSVDDVFIDNNSGLNPSGVITYNSSPSLPCANFTMSQTGSVQFDVGGTMFINSSGNVVLLNIASGSEPILEFWGSGSQTLQSNGSQVWNLLTAVFNVGCSVVFLDDITCGTFVQYGGTCDLNGHNVTCSQSIDGGGVFQTQQSSTGPGTLYLRTGTITCFAFQCNANNISVIPGTATVRPTSAYQVFNGITITNVICTASCTFLNSLSTGLPGGSSTITNLTLMKGRTYHFGARSFQNWNITNQIVQTGSGTTTILKTIGDAGNFTWTSSTIITLSNLTITNGTAAGSGNPFYASGTSTITSCVNWILGSPPGNVSGGWEFVGSSPKKTAYTQPFQDFVRVIPRAIVGLVPEVSLHHYKPPYSPPSQDVLPNLQRGLAGFEGFEASPALQYKISGLRALNLDVLPNLLRGLSGFEASVPPAYRASWRQAANLNVLPTVLQGFEGFEASPALQYKISGLRALNLDVLPNLLHGLSGFEASIPPAYRASWHQAANVDVLPTVLQGFAGFETSQASPYRIPGLVALNLDVLPALLQGFAGFETSQASTYRIPGLAALNLDVLPALLQGFAGFEASQASLYRVPGLTALNPDVLPALLQGFAGFEVSQASPYQIPSRASLNLDVLAKLVTFIGGFETNQLAMYRRFKIDSSFLEVFPSTTTRLFSFEASSSPPSQYKIRPLQALTLDVLPNVPTQVIYPYTPDLSEPVSRYPHPLWTPSDDYWPGLIVPPTPPSRLGVGGGEYVCETEEDINRRECLEKTIQAIDGELAELERKDRAPSDLKIIEPDVMPPDWQAGDDEYSQDERGYWYDPRDPNTYGRPVRPRSKAGKRSGEPFPGRHVHYNFASDMDFGVRRRIIGILDRAEHRGAQIFGSDAFVTQLEGNIQGHLIVPGTNAWVVQLGPEERLAVAREAVAEGFRLVSFDDTSLSFIHRPTYPWKTLFLGATLGAGLMGAGVGVGYLAWGRDLKRLQASENSSPKPKSRKKK